MAARTVYGNTISENGWPMVDEGSCTWVDIPGTSVTLEIQNGQPLQIMRAFAADFHAYIEPLRDPDSACWTPTNSVPTSNHLSGTAMDLNWDSHKFQVADAGFDAAKLARVRALLDFYEGTIFWGNDWDSPKDAMHFQMGYDTYRNAHTADFIARKIRADGFSTYQRGGAGGGSVPAGPDAAQVLSDVMGGRLSLDRYRQLLPAVASSLQACECVNVNRIAMWCAQIGHESGGLYYTEEIASGAAYEGRGDLGNTQPGDGVRFKGRSWIQITGRSNYTRLSQWAFSKGLVPSPTFFVDNPAELANDQYAGLGAAWYWVVARPDINALSDAQDLVTVTQRINGGQNGIDDRRARYNRALAMGDSLLALLGGAAPAPAPTVEELLMSDTTLYPSISIYATPGEGAKFTLAQLIQSIDGMKHRELVEDDAKLGDPDAIGRIARVAAGKGLFTDAASITHAQAVLANIEATHPEALRGFLAKNGVAT
jgi:putative chitinase